MREEIFGAARLILGDAYEIRPTLGFTHADVMDPPYEFDTSGGGKFRKARGHTDQIAAEGLDQGFKHSIINPLLTGAVIVFCHNDQLPKLTTYLHGNFGRQVICAWHKENPMPVANRHYQPDTEFYIHAWSKHFYPRGTLAEKKRFIMAPVGRSKEFDHPTVKPMAVMAKIMANVAGELICDPFMGSGSTGVAALNAGKSFIGIEQNPKHFETACRRLEAAALGGDA